jgi:hypothetical protein
VIAMKRVSPNKYSDKEAEKVKRKILAIKKEI